MTYMGQPLCWGPHILFTIKGGGRGGCDQWEGGRVPSGSRTLHRGQDVNRTRKPPRA